MFDSASLLTLAVMEGSASVLLLKDSWSCRLVS